MTMPHLENCPHSPIGHCLKCLADFVESGLPMPNEDNRPDYWNCICGRRMSLIFSCDDDDSERSGLINLYWCAGCGVVHIHYTDGTGDSRYIPNPKFVGKR